FLDRFDGLLEQTPQQDYTFIGDGEMLRGPIENFSLTLLRAAVLIAACDPAGFFIPTVFARNAVSQTLVLLILGHSRTDLAVDDRREIKREMHRRDIIHCDPPT